ncbi:MAG: rod-binding protein [Candidatus Hydrogenedentota bacterium]
MLYVNPLDAPRASENGALGDNAARRRIALQEMEQYFARLLLREMRASIPEGGIFPRSAEREHFEDMLDEALSIEMARSGQLGLAKMLEEQLRIGEMQKQLKREHSGNLINGVLPAAYETTVK